MGVNQPVADEVKAGYERQRELIDEAKAKNGRPDQKWRDEFVESWVHTTKRTGVTSEAVGLFCEAYRYIGAEPFHRYVAESHDKSAYKKLFGSPNFGKLGNSNNTCLKLSIELFGLELVQPTSDTSLDFLASRIPSFARTKANAPSKSTATYVNSCLIKPFTKQRISEQAKTETASAIGLLRVLKDPIESAYDKSKSDSEAEAADRLLTWLEEQAKVDDSAGADHGDTTEQVAMVEDNDAKGQIQEPPIPQESVADEEAPVEMATEPEPAQKDVERTPVSSPDQTKPSQSQRRDIPKNEPPTYPRSVSPTRRINASDLDMATVITFLTGFEKSYGLLDEQFEKLRVQRSEADRKVRELEGVLAGARAEVSRLQESKDQLTLRVAELEEEVARLDRENDSLQGDVSAASDMIGMVDRQHEENLEAYKKKVASDLNGDYLDFQTVYEIDEMTTDIGEYICHLLEKVFKKLAKNGIVP